MIVLFLEIDLAIRRHGLWGKLVLRDLADWDNTIVRSPAHSEVATQLGFLLLLPFPPLSGGSLTPEAQALTQSCDIDMQNLVSID